VGQAAGLAPAADLWSERGRRRLGEACFIASFEPGSSSSRKMAAFERQTLDTYSTPALYAAFSVVSSGDYERDYPLFRLLSLCTFAAAVLLLGRAFGWSAEAALLFLAAVVLFSAPFAADARPGNVNELQVGGLAAVILLLQRRRDLAAGAALGLLAAFKPNLAPAALLLCLGRAFRREPWTRFALAGAAAAGFAVALSSLYLRDARSWLYWWEALRGLPPQPVGLGNYSLAQWLDSGAIPVLVGAATLAAVRRTRNDIAVLGLGCAATLLGSRLSWLHYYLLLVPFLMFLLRPAAGRRRQELAGAAAIAASGLPSGAHFIFTFAEIAAGALLTATLCATDPAAPEKK
jgi:hypothetical protein